VDNEEDYAGEMEIAKCGNGTGQRSRATIEETIDPRTTTTTSDTRQPRLPESYSVYKETITTKTTWPFYTLIYMFRYKFVSVNYEREVLVEKLDQHELLRVLHCQYFALRSTVLRLMAHVLVVKTRFIDSIHSIPKTPS
jgi:hypothetical protein